MNTYNLNTMKKYFLASFLILVTFIFYCCDIYESRGLYVVNKSNIKICSFITKKEIKTMTKSDIDNLVTIKSNEKDALSPGKHTWERCIKKCKDKGKKGGKRTKKNNKYKNCKTRKSNNHKKNCKCPICKNMKKK